MLKFGEISKETAPELFSTSNPCLRMANELPVWVFMNVSSMCIQLPTYYQVIACKCSSAMARNCLHVHFNDQVGAALVAW